jgi:glycosyltransferase involved in cell wall biosynthesis
MIIPNVVDDAIFKPSADIVKNKKVRFIHISTLGFQKNLDGILDAFKIVHDVERNFELMVFGPLVSSLINKAEQFGLKENVKFMGECPQSEIASCMRESDALILYSRYETFGCVLIEALSCGIPVMVSDIPVMNELLQNNPAGIIIKGEDSEALSSALRSFIDNPLKPDRVRLHKETSALYGMQCVGELFRDFYQLT